jgi:bile acid:Na+ symporter, BASS family
MKQLIVQILQIVAPLSVALIVFAQGLGIEPSTVMSYLRKPSWLLLRSLLAALVLVPAAALAIILVLKPAQGVAVGLAILVSCPPAPLMLKAAPKMGGASAAFMASLHLSLAALAFISVPLILSLLSIPLGIEADVDVRAMTWILARTILIPIGLGLACRAFVPAFADRVASVLATAGTLGLLVVVLFAVAAFYPALLNMDAWSYLVIVAVCATGLAIGHLLGPNDPGERVTLAVECGVRHPALAITIVTANFGKEMALPVLVPCVITFIAVAMLYMIWQRRAGAKSADRGKI